MTLLEQRYRSVLRLLPASYRAEREEEMVDSFMEMYGDAPDETSPRPPWGEIASVLALSVRIRLGAAGSAPRFLAWGETVRLVALIGLAFQATVAVSGVGDLLRGVSADSEFDFFGAPGSPKRLLEIVVTITGASTAVAFAAIMRGRPREAKTAALLGVLPPVYILIKHVVAGEHILPLENAAQLALTGVPVIALFAGFHADVPPVRRSWWLALLPVGGALALQGWAQVLLWGRVDSPWMFLWMDPAGAGIAVFAVIGVFVLAQRRSSSWPLALSIYGVLLLLPRLSLLAYANEGEVGTILWLTACGQCALLGVLATALAFTGLRALPSARPALGDRFVRP
ncbi:hypothetical protein ABZ912_49370 [Nonomuraea angiospora]|uniref:hypothetical protein n=1 Tax=Nonomuraea angiospora TaxID=46172 RepID=UPI00340F4582